MELFPVDNIRPIVTPLLQWYDRCCREMAWRSEVSPYRTWVSEIMLQQTRVEAVRGYFDRWMTVLPDVQSLALASEDQLHKLWEGLGYYNRVKNLQKAARIVCDDYGGFLPNDKGRLLALPGIGEYTAGAIMSIAFGQPCAAVDGNVVRVFSRLLCIEEIITDDKHKRQLAAAIETVMPKERCGDFTQSLMELGALVCLPGAPKCTGCPLQKHCQGLEKGRAPYLPVSPPKPEKKKEIMTVCVLKDDHGNFYLRKRGEKGLLAGMWEPWHCEGKLTEKEIFDRMTVQGIQAVSLRPLGHRHHIFTHKRWEMDGYEVLTEKVEGFQCISPCQLLSEIPLPVAFAPFLKANEE